MKSIFSTYRNIIIAGALLALVVALPTQVHAIDAESEVGVEAEARVRARVEAPRAKVGASTTVSASTGLGTAGEKARGRAQDEIDRRIASLQALSTRVQSMARVSDSVKQPITLNLDAQVKALSDLKLKIENEEDLTALKAEVKSVNETHRVYALVLPQGRIIAAADRIANITLIMQGVGSKLQVRLQEAAASGADTASAQASLQLFADNIAEAQTKAQAAVTAVIALTPDNGDATKRQANAAALKKAQADMKAAHKALTDGRREVTKIMQALGKTRGGVSATSTVNASSSLRTQ